VVRPIEHSGVVERTAPDAVYVGFGYVGQIVVDYQVEFMDVDAPRSDVGGHHDFDFSRFEVAQGPLSLSLGFVSVDRFALDAGFLQGARDVVRAVFRPRKYQYRLVGLFFQHRYQQAFFLGFLDEIDALVDRIDRRGNGSHFHPYRIVQDRPRQRDDILGHRSREKERLTFRRQHFQQPPDIGDESHVEHPVRLVQYEMRQGV